MFFILNMLRSMIEKLAFGKIVEMTQWLINWHITDLNRFLKLCIGAFREKEYLYITLARDQWIEPEQYILSNLTLTGVRHTKRTNI